MSDETILLCEGYHDRSFLTGWALYLGAQDLALVEKSVRDPWGKPVTRGHFGFRDPGGRFFRIIPVNTDTQLFPTAAALLQESNTRPIRDLVIVVDADSSVESRQSQLSNLKLRLKDESTARVHLAVLGVSEDGPGIPEHPCLEKIVCSAIAAAYPERSQSVHAWLQTVGSRRSPAESAKGHSWSYMAGRYAGFGCDAFFREIWRDPEIRDHLIDRLRANGAWESVTAAISGPR